MNITRITIPDRHYIYVQRTAPMDGPAIAEAMGSGFGEVFGYAEEHVIEKQSMPIAIYTDMPSSQGMTFRLGFFVSEQDAHAASDPVMSGTIPAGDVCKTIHIGGYQNMNQTHNAVWTYMDENDIPKGMPIWEVYIDDPSATDEEKLRTEVFRKVG